MKRDTATGLPPAPGYENAHPAPAPIDPSTGQYRDHWVLSDEDRSKGFIRPVRRSYIHETCGSVTTMGQRIAETYAVNPAFYGSTFCVKCGLYFPVGEVGEFVWDDGTKVGT